MFSVHPGLFFFSASAVVNTGSSEYLHTSDAAHAEMPLSFPLTVYLHYTCNIECDHPTDVALIVSVSATEICDICVRSGSRLPTTPLPKTEFSCQEKSPID